MRDRLILILLGVLLLAGGAWLVSATEWADVDIAHAGQGRGPDQPALRDRKTAGRAGGASGAPQKPGRHAAAAGAAGAGVAQLGPVPRAHATPARLGGAGRATWSSRASWPATTSLKGWLPVTESKRALKFEPPAIPPPVLFGKPAKDTDCRALEEPADVTPSYGDSRVFRVCGAYFSSQYLPVNRRGRAAVGAAAARPAPRPCACRSARARSPCSAAGAC